MEFFGAFIAATFRFFQTPFTIFGFTFSMWNIFCFTVITGVVAWILGEVFLGD